LNYFSECNQVRVGDREQRLPHLSPFGPHQHNWNSSSAEIAFHAGNACSACSKKPKPKCNSNNNKKKRLQLQQQQELLVQQQKQTHQKLHFKSEERHTFEKTSSGCTIEIW